MSRKPSLGAIFLTIFLDLLGFGLVLPFLAEEARDGFHTSAFVGTLLGAVYSLMQFFFVPIWGRLSDRVGRRPVLVWSVGATFVGMMGLGLALAYGNSVVWLFAARVFSGIATANLGTASAYIADVTPPEERARGMGLIGMAFGLGFVFGPAMGGLLSKQVINGRHGPLACFVAAGLSLANFAWVRWRLAESLPPEKRATSLRRMAPLDVAAARAAFALPGVARAIAVNFIGILAFTNLDQTFRYYTKDVFQFSEVGTGALLAVIGVVAALVQGALMRPLVRRYAEASIATFGLFVQVLAFATIAYAAADAPGRLVLYLGGVLVALGNGLTQPTISAYISKRADPRAQGNTLGTNQSLGSLARAFGPALGGWCYGALGPQSPYVTGALGMLVAFAVALGLKPTGHATPNAAAEPKSA
jgi:MFS transporter, DHA1 family, tetracycline resistance protein